MSRFLALSCVGFIASAPAYAADPVVPDDQAQGRDDVVVTGQRERRDADPKDVAPPVDTPRSIVELPAEIIAQTGSVTLQDALRTVPGITFGAAEGGNPVGDRPFIRGFDSQGSIYLDGVRDLGAQSREVFAVDSVQIVRGSDGTLGGRGGAGGTINVISKLPQPGSFAAASASYGQADFKRLTADLNHQIGPVAFRVQGLWHDQDVAGRDALFQERWGVAPALTIGLGGPTRLTAMFYHLETDELPDSGFPYRYTIGNAPGTGEIRSEPPLGDFTTVAGVTGDVDRDSFYGLKARDFRETNVDQFTLRAEHDFGPVTLRNIAHFGDTRQAYIFTQPDDSQGNVYGTNPAAPATAGGLVWRRANTRYGYVRSLVNQTDLYGTVRTGGIEHSFAAGAEFAWEKARRGTFVLATGSTISPRCNTLNLVRFNCTSLFSPNPNDPWVNYASDAAAAAPTPIVRGAATTETQQDGETQAVYAFDSITLLPQLIVNLGARFDRFESRLTPPGATQVRIRRTDELFNWQAGLVFKPTPTTSLYGSYATSATPPNSLLGEGSETNALPTTVTAQSLAILDQLEPQETRSYEVGAKAGLMNDRLNLGVALFRTEITNARVQVDPNTVEFIGKSRVQGVEVNANGTILPGWTVFGGYTYLDAEVRNGGTQTLTAPAVPGRAAQVVYVPSVTTGRRIPQTAKHSFTATSNVTLGRLQLGGTAIYQSRVNGGYADNRAATQNAAGIVTVTPATRTLIRTVPGYWRFDARASFDLTDTVQIAVNAQNVTNEAYFSQAFTSHYAILAPGRTVFGTLNVRF